MTPAEKRDRALLRRAERLAEAILRERPRHHHDSDLWQRAARWLRAFGAG